MADIIEPLGVQHALDLQPVVTNPSVMRFIANGRVWSQDKLQRMLAQSDEEWHSQTRGNRGYYWAINCDGRTAGFVGFHRPGPDKNYVLRVLIDPAFQRRGLGLRALSQAMTAFAQAEPDTPLDGAAHSENPGGAALMLRAGFIEQPEGFIGKQPVRRFTCPDPRRSAAATAAVVGAPAMDASVFRPSKRSQEDQEVEPAAKRAKLENLRPHATSVAPGTTPADPLCRPVVPLLEFILAGFGATIQATLTAGSYSDKYAEALVVLQRLVTDYETALVAAVFQLEGRLLGQPAEPELRLQARDSPAARMELAVRYRAKVHSFFNEWQKHLASRPGDSAATRTFRQLVIQHKALEVVLAHTEVHHPTGANVVSLSSAQFPPSSQDSVLTELARLFATKALSFPWKRLSHSLRDVHDMMGRLRSFVPVLNTSRCTPHNVRFQATDAKGQPLFPLQFKDGYLWVEHGDLEYKSMDLLVDLFQEPARLAGRRQDSKFSPLELWTQPVVVRRVLLDALEKDGGLNPHTIREAIFRDQDIKECTQFKPTLGLAVLQYFKARRWLDISAGWGDRLVAAIAMNVDRYQAFDPNSALRAGHEALLQQFVAPAERGRFVVSYSPFEEAQFEPASFDLVFSSPPFFDFEIYTELPGQSVGSYSTLETWLVGFLLRCLKQAWEALTVGGHCVIHITDVYKTRVCEPMCLLMQWQLPMARYVGVMCSSGMVRRFRPLWVFQKDSRQSSDELAQRSARARQQLQQNFAAVYDLVAAAPVNR